MVEFHKVASDKTYLAIGRFMSEFSQVEYTIRHYLAEEISLDESHFDAIIGSYDAALLCSVAREVFSKSRAETNSRAIAKMLNKFLDLNGNRNRVAHGLWVSSKDGGTVHYAPRSRPAYHISGNQAESLEKLADELIKLRANLEREFTSPCPDTGKS